MIPAELLRLVPGGSPRVSALAGSRRNRLLRIDTDAGSFVLRQRTTAAEPPGVDRQREAAIQAAAAAAGLAPRVLAWGPGAGWLLMDHVPGRHWSGSAMAERAALVRVGERLARLHSLPPAPCREFDALAIARAQVERIRRARPDQDDGLANLLTELCALDEQLESLGRPRVMNHGDLDAANLIGDAPQFIDWEYAQLADPLYDIACLLTYYPAARMHRAALLGAAGLGDPLSARRLQHQLRQFALLNQLWRQAETLSG